MEKFVDRRAAGAPLARRLEHHRDAANVTVVALPRGGVPVAWEIASHLNAPLDILPVKKIGFPGHPEYAVGAVASDGATFLYRDQIDKWDLSLDAVQASIHDSQEVLENQVRKFGPPVSGQDIIGKTVILVDDGLATGATMRVAIQVIRRYGPRAIVMAIPVLPYDVAREMRGLVQEQVCLQTPRDFQAVSLWYEHFEPVADDEVRELLQHARHRYLPFGPNKRMIGVPKGGLDERVYRSANSGEF